MRWRRGWDRPIAQLRKGSECDQGPGKLVCGGQPRGKEEMTALGDGTALLKQASTECLEVKHRHKLRGKHGNGDEALPEQTGDCCILAAVSTRGAWRIPGYEQYDTGPVSCGGNGHDSARQGGVGLPSAWCRRVWQERKETMIHRGV